MNRRDLIKTLALLPVVKSIGGEVATISPRNPQAFVITSPHFMTQECADRLRQEWNRIWEGSEHAKVPLLILPGGMELSVIDEVEA